MGEFLCVGICTKIILEKKRINTTQVSFEKIEENLNENFEMEMYSFEDLENYYIWNLKPQYMGKEKMIKFLKEFYDDYASDEEERNMMKEI